MKSFITFVDRKFLQWLILGNVVLSLVFVTLDLLKIHSIDNWVNELLMGILFMWIYDLRRRNLEMRQEFDAKV